MKSNSTISHQSERFQSCFQIKKNVICYEAFGRNNFRTIEMKNDKTKSNWNLNNRLFFACLSKQIALMPNGCTIIKTTKTCFISYGWFFFAFRKISIKMHWNIFPASLDWKILLWIFVFVLFSLWGIISLNTRIESITLLQLFVPPAQMFSN